MTNSVVIVSWNSQRHATKTQKGNVEFLLLALQIKSIKNILQARRMDMFSMYILILYVFSIKAQPIYIMTGCVLCVIL